MMLRRRRDKLQCRLKLPRLRLTAPHEERRPTISFPYNTETGQIHRTSSKRASDASEAATRVETISSTSPPQIGVQGWEAPIPANVCLPIAKCSWWNTNDFHAL